MPPSWHVDRFTDPESLQTLLLRGFMVVHDIGMLIKSLIIGDWTQSPAPLHSLNEIIPGVGWKFQPSNHMIDFSGNKPPSLWAFQNSSHNCKPMYFCKEVVIKNARCLFHLYHCRAISGPGEKKIVTKDASITPITQEITKVLRGSVSGTRGKDQICISYYITISYLWTNKMLESG